IGSWMQTVAVGVLVTQLTHQAHWTGLVAAAAFLPMGLLTPIGGAMADRVDRRMLLLLTTVGGTAFATVLAVLAGIHHDSTVAAEEGRMWSRIASGARAAWADPGCRTAIALIGVTALLVSPFIGLIPAVALKLFHEGEGATATLVTAQGLGAVGGALLITPLAARYGRRRLLVASLVVMPFLVLLYAVSPTLPTAAVSLFLVGAGYIGVLSGLSTAVQLRVSDAYRGRVMSLFMVALGTVYPLGLVIQGTLGDHVSLRVVTAGTAALFLAVVAGV